MEWPSKNIPHGGILHPAKASYNPETKKFLQLLMDESKLTMMQRNKINYNLRNGEPLPGTIKHHHQNTHMPEITLRPNSSKRRSRESIINSGAYQVEKFLSNVPVMDREKEKEKLQNRMAFNKDVKVSEARFFRKQASKEDSEEVNRFDELVREIKEREDWLKEMEEMGRGNQYKQIIEQQIQEKVREMNMLSCEAGDHSMNKR
ncbi:unnamed protein product [Phaedon cochleariae]|uniref:Uncharacterized protein n=1 Tax=Phaedon cochleariae TaxID=80249 RepID=A0A9P0DR18_PHACE|nr:unnamed protein product [Phaedon cochleariae]